MSDPTNVSELARETEQQILRKLAGKCPERESTFVELIQSALSKLVAEKDAEIERLKKQLHDASQISPTERAGIECHINSMLSDTEQEELGLTDRQLHMQVLRILSAYRDNTDDLARHVAALKVAREEIQATFHSENCVQRVDQSHPTSSVIRPCNCWKSNALQRIDKELKP